MSTIFFTSDTHFCHSYVAKLRGFTQTDAEGELRGDAEAWNDFLVERWNQHVTKHDLVWHLGDVGLGREGEVLRQVRRLNGRLQLVTGNHDPCWPGHKRSRFHQRTWLEVFDSVQAFARINVGSREVLMSHFPYSGDRTAEERGLQFRLRDEGKWLLHGHTHSSDKRSEHPRQLHVGLDAWDLRPVSLSEVAACLNTELEKAA